MFPNCRLASCEGRAPAELETEKAQKEAVEAPRAPCVVQSLAGSSRIYQPTCVCLIAFFFFFSFDCTLEIIP